MAPRNRPTRLRALGRLARRLTFGSISVAITLALPGTTLGAKPDAHVAAKRHAHHRTRDAGLSGNVTYAMLAAINDVRARAGLERLRVSGELSWRAAAYARVMMLENRWAHARSLQQGTPFYQVGEILARCACGEPVVEETVAAWLNSPEHRAILLDPTYSYVGIAYVYGYMGGQPMAAWVVRLGSTAPPGANAAACRRAGRSRKPLRAPPPWKPLVSHCSTTRLRVHRPRS